MEEIAQRVWEEVYPDRRQWKLLPEDVKLEWIRFVTVTQSILTGAQSIK